MVLIGYWPLNEESGDKAYDYSGNENHGSLEGSPTQGAKGIVGNTAYEFDGENNYVEIKENHGLLSSETTISIWVYPISWIHDTSGSHVALITSREDTNSGLMFYSHSDGGFRFDWGTGDDSERWETDYLAPTDTWTHLVIKRDEGGRYLYVNGRLQNSTSDAGGPIFGLTELRLAADTTSERYFYRGKMNDIRIYNRSLSIAEVQYLYNVSKRGSFYSDVRKL